MEKKKAEKENNNLEGQSVKKARHSLVDIWTCDFLVRMVKAAFPQFEFMWLADEMKKNLPLELCFTQVIPIGSF